VTETLSVGLEGEQTFTVTREMSPPHLPVPVLSTPTMVQQIEQTCLLSVQPLLEEGLTTVGTHICVSHARAAAEGQDVTVHSRLTEINKRRLTFDVIVDGPAGRLSEGTHQRTVVDFRRMAG
jgi:fluoroacetyl-CoA thioesterase